MWRSWLALGCKVGSLPTTYLGLPLGAPHRSMTVWDGVEERMRKNLARWKSQDISKGGRITLIRSTLASMPIYYMSMLSMWGGESMGRNKGDGVLRKRGGGDAWVKDVWCSNEGGGSWNPFFSRPFNDWELDEWVLPATVKETPFGVEWVFCGKKEEGCLESKSFVSFLDGWKARNKISFEEE
ncbi:hypothetical protein CK203_015283 [Vitis vinifera]|uniref:Uncharacterized protein n=1 Tax=Vitis vinifera TaxID=29760 RepID=A0A438JKH5_VITVI|nr:hypothetical protein CK203_015283 [Vitis vinifera]